MTLVRPRARTTAPRTAGSPAPAWCVPPECGGRPWVVALLFRKWRLAAAAACATGLKLLTARGVKLVVQRRRPDTSVPDADPWGNVPPPGLSFVSGHMILTGTPATIIAPYLPGRWKLVSWILVAGLGVGLSTSRGASPPRRDGRGAFSASR